MMRRKLFIRREWVWIVGMFLAVRVLFSAIGVVVLWEGDPVSPFEGHQIYETKSVTVQDGGELARLFINGWYRWDTGWYLKIAALGYSAEDGSIVFPPLYPILIRLVAFIVEGNYLLSALLISNVSCLVALILFAKLAFDSNYSSEEVLLAVLFLITFPSAFYLFAGYTEALFLALTLASFIFARQCKWGLAGVSVFFASLTRTQGWLLCIPLGWMALVGECDDIFACPGEEIHRFYRSVSSRMGWRQIRANLRSGGWLVIVLPVIAFTGRMLWLKVVGLGTITEAYSNNWNSAIIAPWEGIRLLFVRIFNGDLNFIEGISLILMVSFIVLAIYGIKHLPVAFSLYIWTNIGLLLMRFYPTLPIAYERYLLLLFPIFYLLGTIGNRRRPFIFATIIFLGLQLIFLWLFMQWVWVA